MFKKSNNIFLLFLLFFNFLYAEDTKKGELLFKENCINCHTNSYKPFDNIYPRNLEKSLLNDEQLFNIIKYGTSKYGSQNEYMIGYSLIYNDEEIKSIVKYLRSLNKGVKEGETILNNIEKLTINEDNYQNNFENGRKIYLKRCIHCHGAFGEGDGTAVKSSKGFIQPYNLKKSLLTTEQMFLFTKKGAAHFGALREEMPAWETTYNDIELQQVIFYLKELLIKKEKYDN